MEIPIIDRAQFVRRIQAHGAPQAVRPKVEERSAVAVVTRFEGDGPEVLLMKRAQREGDGWSGHVSFPGGRESREDQSLLATAMRETREEVGLDLATTATLAGELSTIQAISNGQLRSLSVTPFVLVQDRPSPLVLNYEAEEAFWLPLAQASSGELDEVYPYVHRGQTLELPSWNYKGRVIWGLTFNMLRELLTAIAARSDK